MRQHNCVRRWVVLSLLPVLGCGGNGSTATPSGAAANEDFTTVLQASVNDVIIPYYTDLTHRAAELSQCVATLKSSPTDAQLDACRDAWVAARVPWEHSEGWLFGPVEDQGLDPAMDSWPVDSVQLDALIKSNVTLTTETIMSDLGGGLKGFHTIEYLLWGVNQAQTAGALASVPRQLEYLSVLGEALQQDTGALLLAWTGDSTTDGYGARFINSGLSGSTYSQQSDAVQELIGGMSGICDEVANSKIADPYKARDPSLVESQFSYNSIKDFSDNIRGARDLYYASRDGTAAVNSLSAIAAKYEAQLDARVREKFEAAINAIEAISADGQPFPQAVLNPSKDAVIESAQTAVGELLAELRGGLRSLVSR